MPEADLPAIMFCARHSAQVWQVADIEAVLIWQSHRECNYNMQDVGDLW